MGLQDILNQVKSVLNETRELQASPVVFNADHVPDTVQHKSYRLVAGPIQSSAVSQGNGSLCSEKSRLLFVYVAVRNRNNEQKAHEELVRLEELIEKNLLTDPRTAVYLNTLQNVETDADAENLFWIMEMVFDFDYRRDF
ncbi:MAG: hypothetical protein ACE5G9_13665 [Nitrospinales bacterium]